MADERCRITVVGERRRVDLALPAQAPIAAYIPDLTRMCGQSDDEALPAAWSLALPGAVPFPPGSSLGEAGVVDGAVLYLRDIVEGELDSPVVADVEELVERAGRTQGLWDAGNRAVSVLGLGLLALLTGVVALAVRLPAGSPAVTAVAIVAGFVVPPAVWAVGRGTWPVPGALRPALALAACPMLALAGYALAAGAGTGAVGAAVPVAVGVNIGTLLALAAVPGTATATAELLAVLGLPVTVALAALHANQPEAAAVVAVAAFVLLSTAPTVAGRLATLFPGTGAGTGTAVAEPDVTDVVRRGRRTLAALTLLTSLLLAACLVRLGASHNPYALGLAGCLGLALVLRAGSVRLLSGVLPVLLAGACGLGTLLVRLPDYAPVRGWEGPAAVLAAGLVLLGAGAALLHRVGEDRTEPRPAWLDQLSGTLGVLSVPLAVAVFGLFDYLVGAGGKL
ncbi:type VII secretion integral membrane protein EccD [Streptomyces prunicolor]|uniref:type VII secretion integral membrane protein EccD n=1 Tax=Streptomyces prunicolor TaxID=67348 RepID=UPI0034188790